MSNPNFCSNYKHMTRLKKGRFFTAEAQRSGEFKVFGFDVQFARKIADIADYPALKPYSSLCLCVSVVHFLPLFSGDSAYCPMKIASNGAHPQPVILLYSNAA